MKEKIIKIYSGKVTTEEHELTLHEFCRLCDISPEILIELVTEGILEPKGKSKTSWRFSFELIHRVKKVQRLQNDLDLNLSGVALAMHLLDRIEELERTIAKRF